VTCDHKLGFVLPDAFPACSLVEKERLLSELMRSQKEFESMKHSFEHKLQVRAIAAVVDLTALVTCELQEMQSAIGRTTSERDRVLADMERIEQARETQNARKNCKP